MKEVDQRLEDVSEDGRHGEGIVAGLYTPAVMSARELRLLSVVAPMLNEEGLAAEFCARAAAALEGLPYELVVVDDGSTDGTAAILDQLAERDPRIRVLHLSRPFGHQMALTAGLDHARGDAVVMIDGDLQDPPELIPELLASWRDGADIVLAKRRAREGETRFKLASARWFYALMGRLAQVELEPNAGDFRLFDRAPLDALLRLRERSRFLRGMSSWVGFRREVVEYDRAARGAGESKYPIRRMLRFALDGVTSFSNFPLQLAALAGVLCALVAMLGLPLTIVARYSGIYERGVPSLLFVVLLIGGIQLLALGLIGEYLGRIYDEVKQRPLYVVSSARNLDADGGAAAALAGVERRDEE
jgi:dolichol-phosphate mannosyltransferase